ncbi:Fasciclin-domain-containing protein [Choiromyces venosus 120613-1]|uniref:Fasciclin-domain-containing protein n=1 Tax=Choiromyces venosus 120613-1 TaxID=1336337 RepID=A0A3N4J7N4_9PEZI|nr:Fasciclin-domain-containing protein [Choiromyces venosus 120613-1]RPB03001.1 Fasciclin-domain-containing protein [Choiromyces venosus 120613-1]
MRYFKPSLTLLLTLAAGSTAQSIVDLLEGTPELSNLTSIAVMYPDLITTLSGASNITILAPNNKAFSDAMKMMPAAMAKNTEYIRSLLTYHVLNGTYRAVGFGDDSRFLPTLLTDKKFANLTAGDSQVVKAILMDDHASVYSGLNKTSMVSRADTYFTGGVVHIIDSVLTLPMNVSTTAIAANLTAVAGALAQANLVTTVDTLTSITVFAPSNPAFQAIGNLVGGLSNKQLASILTYHVVPDRAFTSDLTNNQKLRTIQGEELTIRLDDGDVYVNGAKVVASDVITNNGVVHVIDGVLNPNATNDEPDTGASTQAPAFPSATGSSDVPFTSGVLTPTGSRINTSSPSATSSGTGAQPNSAGSITGNVVIAVIGAALAFAAGIMV